MRDAASARLAGVFGAGAFFGMTASFSSVFLPSLLRHHLPPRARAAVWNDTYTRVTHQWVPLGLAAAAAYLYAATKLRSQRLLAAAISMAAIVPCTLIFVFPHVRRLKSFLQRDASDDEVKHALRRWGWWHNTRTLAAGLAFVLGLSA